MMPSFAYITISVLMFVVSIITYKSELLYINKGRFCNTIASVAVVHTSKQSDKRMQTKEILSSRN